LPQAVAKDQHVLGALHIVCVREHPAKNRLDTQHLEKPSRDRGAVYGHRFATLHEDPALNTVTGHASDALQQLAGSGDGLDRRVAERIALKA
jgi:hypothetical protein